MAAFDFQQLIFSTGWALIHFLWQGTLITLAYWAITRNIESIYAKYWTGMSLVVLSLMIPLIGIINITGPESDDGTLVLLSKTIIAPQQFDWQGLLFYFINISLPFIVLVWAAVVMILSMRIIHSWSKLSAISHQCEPHTTNQLKQYIKNVAIKLDLPTIPFLKVSSQIKVPAAYGFLKPTVLIPLSLISQIPKNQIEAIITHELCHLKRNDFIHNIIQLFADIMLFFHPGIRWMNNDIRHIREQCCDQLVLTQGTQTLTYAKALTNIAALTNGIKLNSSVQLGINDGALLKRVKFLLQNKSSQSYLMAFLPFILIIFSVILLQPSAGMKVDSANLSTNLNRQYMSNNNTENPNKRKISNPTFYPKHFQQAQSQSTQNGLLSKPPQINSIDPELMTYSSSYIKSRSLALNKAQLKTELNQDMSISNYQADQLPDALKTFQPLPKITADVIRHNNLNVVSTSNQRVETNNLIEFKNTPDHSAEDTIRTDSSIMPVYSRYQAPKYPQSAWYFQIDQDVIATFKIRSNGQVYDINMRSQNNKFKAFEKAAEKAMRYWRFDVESLNATTLQRTYQQIFSFNISEGKSQKCETTITGSRLSRHIPCNK